VQEFIQTNAVLLTLLVPRADISVLLLGRKVPQADISAQA
jgi:hypothetical protein